MNNLGELAWDINSTSDGSSTIMGEMFTGKTMGHTGYTGTSFMIDSISKTSVILFSHCVRPTGSEKMFRLSSLIANIGC